AREMKSLETHIGGIESEIARLPGTATIPEVMNVEGRIRNIYYTALDEIFPENYRIIKRSRMPPANRMNTLISFGNSLMYTTTLSEIYNTLITFLKNLDIGRRTIWNDCM
ncbi:CriSPR-associated Cas1 family protein, partial [groundwater metagenome]